METHGHTYSKSQGLLRLSTDVSSHYDQNEDAVHVLLARFTQPPKYAMFDVIFINPLIPLLHRLPDFGRFSVARNVRYSSKEYVEFSSETLSPGTLKSPDVEAMKSLAVKSMFGKGRENVYDLKIRKGKELKYGVHFAVNDEASLRKWFTSNDIANSIAKDLFTGSTTLTFKFNKLAIYEEGGRFLEHRDTAYTADHKGTLLVNIPSLHQGGDLLLKPACKDYVENKQTI